MHRAVSFGSENCLFLLWRSQCPAAMPDSMSNMLHFLTWKRPRRTQPSRTSRRQSHHQRWMGCWMRRSTSCVPRSSDVTASVSAAFPDLRLLSAFISFWNPNRPAQPPHDCTFEWMKTQGHFALTMTVNSEEEHNSGSLHTDHDVTLGRGTQLRDTDTHSH